MIRSKRNLKSSTGSKYLYSRTFTIYYNDPDLIDNAKEKLKNNNIFFSGLFRYILENEDVLDAIIEQIPEDKSYKKGIV